MINQTDSTLKQDQDAVNGIINGYCSPGRMLTYLGVTNFGQLGQWTSDQAEEPRMNANRDELLPFSMIVHLRPLAYNAETR